MKQNDKKERISDWMSLLEDTSVPMDEASQSTDSLRARVKLRMNGAQKQALPTRRHIPGKWLPLTAALIALSITAAFAVDCAVNQRLPFIFNSEDALVEAQYQNEVADASDADENVAIGYSEISDDPVDPDAFAKMAQEDTAWRFDVSNLDESETLVSDEEGTDSDPYTRKLVMNVVNGGEVNESIKRYQETDYTSDSLSQIAALAPMQKDWDLSDLEQNYTMVEGCNWLYLREKQDGSFIDSYLRGVYRTANGGVFTVSASSDTETDYADDYTNVGEDGFSETYTTKDGVEVSIYGNSQRAYAELVLTTDSYYDSFSVSSQCVTQQEMEEIVDSLNLSTFVSSFTAAAE